MTVVAAVVIVAVVAIVTVTSTYLYAPNAIAFFHSQSHFQEF